MMPSGGKMTLAAKVEDGKAQFTVSATGEGIPPEKAAMIFTPLFTTKSKGQGFGLAVVKRLTEALGGTVTFKSEIAKGTRFTVEFPV
jgi:signal transduction histidine kinase